MTTRNPATGRNFSNNPKNPNPIHPMAWPIINTLLAAAILYLAYAAGALNNGL
jgi:hypothetical protein